MAAVAVILGRVAGAVIAVIALMAAASSLLSSPVDATPRMDAESGAIWTSRPVRIDPKNQHYERLPDPYPFKFSESRALNVLDNATFTLKGDTYVLDGIARIDPRKLCIDGQGRRLACGAGARTALRSAFRRSFIECSRTTIAQRVFLAKCRSNGAPVADILKNRAGQGLVASAR